MNAQRVTDKHSAIKKDAPNATLVTGPRAGSTNQRLETVQGDPVISLIASRISSA